MDHFFSITIRPLPINPQRSTFDMLFSRPSAARNCIKTKCCNFEGVKPYFDLTMVDNGFFYGVVLCSSYPACVEEVPFLRLCSTHFHGESDLYILMLILPNIAGKLIAYLLIPSNNTEG